MVPGGVLEAAAAPGVPSAPHASAGIGAAATTATGATRDGAAGDPSRRSGHCSCPLSGSVPGSQRVAVDGGQRFGLYQPGRDQVEGADGLRDQPHAARPRWAGALGPSSESSSPAAPSRSGRPLGRRTRPAGRRRAGCCAAPRPRRRRPLRTPSASMTRTRSLSPSRSSSCRIWPGGRGACTLGPAAAWVKSPWWPHPDGQ